MTKKILTVLLSGVLTFGCVLVTSCDKNDDVDKTEMTLKEWQEYNNQWLIEQATKTNSDGTAYYQRCVMPTDPQSYVLMHRIGEEHTGNLKPLYSSTTKVNYTLKLANDSVIDNGTLETQLNSSGYISGWGLAIMQLHVGDSAQFVIPYALGYGTAGNGVVPPYSNLQFNIRLLDITGYETRP